MRSGGASSSMNRSQLYGVEKAGAQGVRPINKFRHEYISKRNGRSGQYSQGPDERGDPYQQKDVFTRHPNKLSKLKNTSSSSESQLRDQRVRRELSNQLNDNSRLKGHAFQQQ